MITLFGNGVGVTEAGFKSTVALGVSLGIGREWMDGWVEGICIIPGIQLGIRHWAFGVDLRLALRCIALRRCALHSVRSGPVRFTRFFTRSTLLLDGGGRTPGTKIIHAVPVII